MQNIYQLLSFVSNLKPAIFNEISYPTLVIHLVQAIL